MARQKPNKHATLFDFRDLDLLYLIEDRADDEGWAETEDLASELRFESMQPLGIRLSWMRRYGMLDYDEKKKMWRLTDGAGRVMDARLRAAQQKSVQALPDEAMIDVMANITARYNNGNALVATMLRREFMYGTKKRL